MGQECLGFARVGASSPNRSMFKLRNAAQYDMMASAGLELTLCRWSALCSWFGCRMRDATNFVFLISFFANFYQKTKDYPYIP